MPDGAFSASSSYDANHGPARSRLNLHSDNKGRKGAWSSKTNDGKQWLQIDFGELVHVTKVATQGRQDADQWVTKYTLSYSVDGIHWAEYKENSVTWVSNVIIDHFELMISFRGFAAFFVLNDLLSFGAVLVYFCHFLLNDKSKTQTELCVIAFATGGKQNTLNFNPYYSDTHLMVRSGVAKKMDYQDYHITSFATRNCDL